MILASAQTRPVDDININLSNHYKLIALAADNGAKLITFPEMSVTGYERANAERLSFFPNDPRLDKLMELSFDNRMIIIVGVPLKMNSALYIGSIIIFPDNSFSFYTKQFLHPGEEEFFSSSFDYNPLIEIDNEKISLAICADIDNPLHPENAYKNNTTIYIPGIFFSSNGIPGAHDILSKYAKKYSMNILMSNFCGICWGLEAGGRSAFWNNNGDLIAALGKSQGLVIVEKNDKIWSGKTIECE